MRLIEPRWPAPANVRAFTTTIPAPADALIRAELPEQAVMPVLKQVHGVRVVDLDSGEVVSTIANGTCHPGEADACCSRRAQQVCRVVTADCLPLLLTNRAGTEVAAVHAGWRGLAAGVVENTLAILQSDPGDLLAWLGPAISQSHFEVGEEVRETFLAAAPQYLRDKTAAFFLEVGGHKYMADLYGLARLRLESAGIQHIFGGEHCTFAEADLFYSYRRHGGRARMSSIICFS